jgi:trimeric autotransporter adhesin
MKSSSVLAAALAVVVSACVGGSSSDGRRASPVLDALELQSPGNRFAVRSTLQLEAFGFFSDNSKQKVSAVVAWDSSNPEVIAIDQTGIARLLSPGRAQLTARLEGRQSTTVIEVTPSTATALELRPADLFQVPQGLMPQLHLFATFSDGTRREVTQEALWTASGQGAWPLQDKGHFRFDQQGPVTVIGRFEGLEARHEVHVLPAAPTGLELAAMSAPMHMGDSAALSVVARFTDGSTRDVSADAITRSLDGNIATFASGQVRAVAPGSARLVAEYRGFTASRAVVVTARELTFLTGNLPHADLPGGRTIRFQAFAAFEDGVAIDVTEAALWSTSDGAIAQLTAMPGSAGLVLAKDQGAALITARYGGRSVSFSVAVQAPVLEEVNTSIVSARLLVGQHATFAIAGRFSDGSVFDLSPAAAVRASPFVSVLAGQDAFDVEGLAAGPATVELEVGGFLRTVSFTVVGGRVEALQVIRQTSQAGGPARALKAFATYDDGTVAEVTELCDWASRDSNEVAVSALPGSRGALEILGGRAVEITATMAGQSASFQVGE